MDGIYRGLLCCSLLLASHGAVFAWGQPEALNVAIAAQDQTGEMAPLPAAGEAEDPEFVEEWDERASHFSGGELASFWR